MTSPDTGLQLTAALLQRLADAVTRHHTGGWGPSAVPRLSLIAVDDLAHSSDLLYVPMICFTASGTKRLVAGEHVWTTAAGEMFFNFVELPVRASFDQVPYRSAVLSIDRRRLTDLFLELDEDEPPAAERTDGPETATMSPRLVDAVARWVELLDTPDDIGPLAARTETEVLYRLVRGPLGPSLRRWVRSDCVSARIRDTAAWIVEHYTRPLSLDDVAAVAHMSPASLHRHFKAATGMSPLQFQRHLRLQEARRIMISGEVSAAQAAQAVGYASATQFNREYRRHHGLPPAQDARRVRTAIAADGAG